MIRKNIKEMNNKANALRLNYKKACDAYLERFCELIEMDMHYAEWVDVGGVAEIGDYYVSIQDMITAVEHDVPCDKFFEWYDYTIRVGMLELPTCNLDAWLRGCPIYSEEQMKGIEDVLDRMQKDQEKLDRLIKEAKEAL